MVFLKLRVYCTEFSCKTVHGLLKSLQHYLQKIYSQIKCFDSNEYVRMAQKLAIWPVEPIRDGLLLGHAIKTRLLRCINSVSLSAKYLFLPLHIYQHKQLGVVNSGRSYFNFTIHNEQKSGTKAKVYGARKKHLCTKSCMHSYCIKFYFERAYFLLRHFHKYTDALPFFLMALIPISDLNIIHKKNSTLKNYLQNQNFVIFGMSLVIILGGLMIT